ncbi:MAG: DUF362 domain-containing protein [Prolixibacteraceae bacterium]|nr:DUF362 domain-containing protein [Prolixibacteraceae bacterium]
MKPISFIKRKMENPFPKKQQNFLLKVVYSITGFFALVWILLRVIPKPSRANYPCINAAFPFASTFVLYVAGLASSVLFFKKAGKKLKQHKWVLSVVFILMALVSVSVAMFNSNKPVSANITVENAFDDPLGPNSPIGEAKGIFPGRVVWVHNPDATNANCTNRNKSDAYFNDKNTNQDIVNNMISKGIKQLTGKETIAEAWDVLFRYFNTNHGRGDVGYTEGETIFIKINAVTAWSGATPDGEFSDWAGIEYDTSPQTILTILRHLVNDAGVSESNIYVGDPMCDIWNHLYEKFYAEFPNVKYCSKRDIPGRYRITKSTEPAIVYSDKGNVLSDEPSLGFYGSHSLFEEMRDADYLINIPTMKGHRWAGVTFFAKNHFGSNTAEGSWGLHKGLMNPDNNGMRYGYGLYRVLVDLMGSRYLGGKTMLYFMEGLWSTSYEHQPPQKFQSTPFNNHWSSSLLFSLDPVAIESVCLDILQKEFVTEDLDADPPRYTYVQWDGVDDYLHQAADPDRWPEDIEYDPDNTGEPISSLGVHEHWNNPDDMKYSRNLGSGNGIELVYLKQSASGTPKDLIAGDGMIIIPNVIRNSARLQFARPVNTSLTVNVCNLKGEKVHAEFFSKVNNEKYREINLSHLPKGTYIVHAIVNGKKFRGKIVKE